MKKNYFKNLLQVALLLAAPFVVSSCDDVIGQEDNPVASYVQWKTDTDKAEIELGIGKTYTRTATAVSSAIIAYSSDDEKIATVDPVSGEVKGVAVGETNINAVISGMSTNGRSVFEATKISYKVKVVDLKAKLTRKVDSKVVYNADADSIVKLSDLFTFYPALGTKGATNITVELCNDKKASATPYAPVNAGKDIGALVNPTTATTGVTGEKNFKITGNIDNEYKAGDITDTLYIAAKIDAVNTAEGYEMPTTGVVSDTVMVIVTKSIAFINKEGKREILAADKYKEVDLTSTTALDAGTYFVTKAPSTTPSAATDIKGDVTLIFKNTINAALQNLDDKTDKATLNIFGEAIQKTPSVANVYVAWNPAISLTKSPSAITNFGEINIYTGTITVNGKTRVKDINVYGGKLQNTTAYANAFDLTGTLTINGGEVKAIGTASDAYAIVGNVVLNKGTLTAENGDYRAINGTLTAGEGFEFLEGDTNDKSKAKKIEGTSSNSKYIWGQAKK